MNRSFRISGEKIGNPVLIGLLKKVTDCFNKINQPFYVIGAIARDIIMRQLTDTASHRRTQDLDIAITIPDWKKFEEISKTLQAAGLKKSEHQHQRFYMGNYELDVVPYGGVSKDDDNIYWPPEEDVAMSVKGFDEVLQEAINVSIDGEFDIKVAPLHGLFLLKLNAWFDRHQQTDKDAEDMGFILANYFDANVERKFASEKYNEVYELEDFDVFLAGGVWVAYDLVQLLNVEQCAYYGNAIQQEVNKEEASMLVNQIIEHNSRLPYDLVLKTWQEMANIFKQRAKSGSKK